MPGTVVINLAKPITSAKVLDGLSGASFNQGVQDPHSQRSKLGNLDHANLMQDLDDRKAEVSQAWKVLKVLVDKLNQFYNEAFARHKEEIAKLSVEIARKILMQEVQKGNYQIEAIVKEAIETAPAHRDVVVHLNPKDLVQFQRFQQDDPERFGSMDGIKFIADPNIGRAECLVESPKGIIESLIDEHLKRIAEALKKAK